jgi:ribonuclease-3 family protein
MLSFSQPYELNNLHTQVCKMVCATAQAEAVKQIATLLTEDENFIYRKCKNAKTNNIPKHASMMEYKYATAFEGIIGFLYMNGQNDRLCELFELVYGKNS